MKAISLLCLALLLTLSACSTTSTAPVESETTVLPENVDEPAIVADSMPSPDSVDSTENPALATSVDTPSSSAADSFSDLKSADSATPPEAPVVPEPPPPVEMPMPESSLAANSSTPTTPAAEALPPVVNTPAAGTRPDRNLRQDYAEYQDRVRSRADAEDALEQRALFPHEDGAFQLGVDYGHNAFSGYDFNPGTAQKFAESKGAGLSFNYFPLRSLSLGRLGVGVEGATYWSKFKYTSATTGREEETVSKRAIDTYGAKLLYEFQYFLGQLVVPFAYFGYERVVVKALNFSYAGVTFPRSQFDTQFYGGGAHLNLNRLESSAASKALASSGIRKFYLTYSFLQRAVNTGAGHFLGLRFEY